MELDLSGSISSESAPAFWILNRSLTHGLIEIGTSDENGASIIRDGVRRSQRRKSVL